MNKILLLRSSIQVFCKPKYILPAHFTIRKYSKSNWDKDLQNKLQKLYNGTPNPLGRFFNTRRAPMNLFLMTGLVFISTIALYPIFGKNVQLLYLLPVIAYLKRRFFSGPKTEMSIWDAVRCYDLLIKEMQNFSAMTNNKSLAIIMFSVHVPHKNVGMVVMADNEKEIDIKMLSGFFTNISQDCAIPMFIRIVHHITKTAGDYTNEGYDVNVITDKLYYYNVKSGAYESLTKSVYEDIINGKVAF